LAGLHPLSIGSEKYSPSISQHAILRPWPIKPLLYVFQGIGPLKPRIKGAMDKYEIGWHVRTSGKPSPKALKLPDSMNQDSIVIACVNPQPGNEVLVVAILSNARSERMNNPKEAGYPWIIYPVKCNNLYPVAHLGNSSTDITKPFHGPPVGRVQGSNYVQ
jgi:hypothetical protein